MHVLLAKWGNSLGLRVPNALARQLGIGEGQRVKVTVERGRLIVAPVAPAYRLKDLLANMNPKAMRAAFDWDAERGRDG
jgi:antitoxin MazE